MRTRLIDLNGSGGAYVDILATIPCSAVEIREDESVTAQGMDYQLPEDAFATTYNVSTPGTPDTPQIRLGDLAAPHRQGRTLGLPERNSAGDLNYAPATVLIKLRSRTGTQTKVRVTEYE